MVDRIPRRWRAALLVPLGLALAACADDAPLDTFDPQGPEAPTIDTTPMTPTSIR